MLCPLMSLSCHGVTLPRYLSGYRRDSLWNHPLHANSSIFIMASGNLLRMIDTPSPPLS